MDKAVLKEDWVGTVIDKKFPLLERLGGNEQAAVFRTEMRGTPSVRAAIKLIPASDEAARARLASWELASGLSHPHLMRILATGRVRVDDSDLLYMVSEYADEALSQIIPERPLTPAEVTEMLQPIVDALLYLHGRGLVYRDLQPSNVLVVADQIKLPPEQLIRAGTLERRTGPFRPHDAPETGALNASPAADAWSLGFLIVEALTQKPPTWNPGSKADPLVPANLPSPFAEIARRCLRRDPARRLSIAQVKAVLGGAPLPADAASEASPAKQPQVAPASGPGAAIPSGRPSGATTSVPPAAAVPPPPPAPKPTQAPVNPASYAVPKPPVRDLPTEEPTSRRSRTRMIALLALALIVVLAVVFTRSHKQAAPAPPPPDATSANTAAAPAAAPTTASPSPAASAPVSTPGATARGEALNRVQPDVPENAMHTIRGKFEIVARLRVDASGNVVSASLEHRGPSRYFATRALDAARKWTFKPPQQNGQPVPSEWNLRFEFRHNGVNITPDQARP